MNLPVPGTLREAFSPTSVMNVIFGLDVFYYPKDKPRPLLSVIWALLILSLDVILMKMSNLSELTVFMGSTIAATNYRLNLYVHTIFVAISMFSSQSRSQATRSTFRKLIPINARLKTLGIPNDYGQVYKAQVIELIIGFSLMVVIQILDYIYIGHDYPGKFARISFLTATHHCIVFTFILDITYNTSIRYFGNRFQRLKTFLVESYLENRGKAQLTLKLVHTISHYNSLVFNAAQESAESNRLADNQRLLHISKVVRKLHGDLCTTAMDLNQVFGLQVLLSIALSFGILTALLYTGYTLAADLPTTSMFEAVMIKTAAGLWIGFYVVKISRLAVGCATTASEAKKTGELIQDILEMAAVYNRDIRDEINILSLQLIQNRLCFTAKGFFTLDYALLTKATRSTFRKIITINAQLKLLGIPCDYDLVYKAQVIELIIGFTYMTVLQIVDFLFVGLDYPSEFARTSFLVATHHHMFFTFVLDFTYNTSIRYFCNRFRRLNLLLVELELRSKGTIEPTKESVSRFLRYNSLASKEIQESAVSDRLMDNERLLHITTVIRKLHGDLCTTAMELSRVFGFQVLLSIGLSFGVSIALLYTGYTLAADSPTTSLLNDVMLKITAVLWIGFYIVKITWLVIGCAATTREAKKTGGLIQNILESAAMYNKDIRDEINILTLQLIQNPLCFTAQGFFTLDYTLISKALGFGGWCLVIRKPQDTGETLDTERYHCDNVRWQWLLVEAAA
ncbi:uncharacterized protein LOC124414558 [Diprion similis]|uniref:uncharacterized protein LOC124414558 n=1 Tax=Diprion similis TaxID=362088 RepID=UPI001EF7DE2F|nr:uncharacterized protein LOC124414558 [Diprion similis]